MSSLEKGARLEIMALLEYTQIGENLINRSGRLKRSTLSPKRAPQ